jgi:hypothetical protein
MGLPQENSNQQGFPRLFYVFAMPAATPAGRPRGGLNPVFSGKYPGKSPV